MSTTSLSGTYVPVRTAAIIASGPVGGKSLEVTICWRYGRCSDADGAPPGNAVAGIPAWSGSAYCPAARPWTTGRPGRRAGTANSRADLQWISDAFSLAFAGLLIIAGSVGDPLTTPKQYAPSTLRVGLRCCGDDGGWVRASLRFDGRDECGDRDRPQ